MPSEPTEPTFFEVKMIDAWDKAQEVHFAGIEVKKSGMAAILDGVITIGIVIPHHGTVNMRFPGQDVIKLDSERATNLTPNDNVKVLSTFRVANPWPLTTRNLRVSDFEKQQLVSVGVFTTTLGQAIDAADMFFLDGYEVENDMVRRPDGKVLVHLREAGTIHTFKENDAVTIDTEGRTMLTNDQGSLLRTSFRMSKGLSPQDLVKEAKRA